MNQTAGKAYNIVKNYLEPDYVTGAANVPPCNIQFSPFTMVVDLETMTVMGRDTMTVFLSPEQIIEMMNQANE
ncbi:MAG: hypothetical protein GY854_26525 [Deltaproteobacteria bacterium]|nr:hypothetical protein [Deltaproteobacteria bacterium]